MKRFPIAPHDIDGSTITVTESRQVHHLRNVLRARLGDVITCIDGTGAEYLGTIIESQPRHIRMHITRTNLPPRERILLCLAQGISKGDRFEWMVQKATELGVLRITPLLTARTVVRLTDAQGAAKHARWQRIAQEAAKQCGRSTVPVVDLPMKYKDHVPLLKETSLALIPTLEISGVTLEEALQQASNNLESVALLIGPEGDFTREEVELAQQHGAQPVSLGKLTLRSETAAIATLAIVRYAFKML